MVRCFGVSNLHLASFAVQIWSELSGAYLH
jgi:hypothetical protein